MKDFLSELNESIPVRRSPEQHDKLFEYVSDEAKKVGLEANIELLDRKHKNIVIGDVESADVVFTAHYDTPARSLVPNLTMPKNPNLAHLYMLGIPLVIAFASLGIAYAIYVGLRLPDPIFALIYLVLYFGTFFGIFRCGTNKTNKNDNTSGVAAVLSIMERTPKNVAYILFDNEEKGLLGSKAYNKAHKEMMKDKLVINLDCVGNGNNIIVIARPDAENHAVYKSLTENLVGNESYNVYFCHQKDCCANTDYKNFKTSVAVMACKRKKNIFYTPNIHTAKDTEAYTENITFIADALAKTVGGNI